MVPLGGAIVHTLRLRTLTCLQQVSRC